MGILGGGIFNKLSDGYNSIKASREEAARAKLYTTFQIPEEEEILSSHVHTMLGMITDGVVATRRALYLHESHRGEDGTVRIPYWMICEYIAFQIGERDPVCLYHWDGSEREILSGTLVDTKIGPALVRRIQDVQAQLLEQDPDHKEQLDKVARRAIEEGRDTVRHNGLSPRLIYILLYLRRFERYRRDALFLVAQDHAQRYTQRDYAQQMEDLCGTDSDALLPELLEARGAFVKTFVKDMLNLSFAMEVPRLGVILDRLSKEENSGFSQFELGVLAARALRSNEVERFAAALENTGNGEAARKLRFFFCIYRNRIMKTVFETLRRGEEVEKAYLNVSDGFGLTAFHYALILDDPDMLGTVFRQKEWMISEPTAPYLDYIDLALLLYGSDNAAVLIEDTKTARKFKARGTRNEVIATALDIGATVLDIAMAANAAPRAYDDDGDNGYYDDGEDDFPKISTGTVAGRVGVGIAQSAIESSDEKWQRELEQYIMDRLETAELTVAQWKSGKNPLLTYLLKLYTDPDYLYEVLSSPMNRFKLLRRGDDYFIVPDDFETVMWDENAAANSSVSDAERPYGSTWFSEEAHTDMQALRKEYRALVKEYHPDVCTLPNSTEIIQEIFNEYSEILLVMEQA